MLLIRSKESQTSTHRDQAADHRSSVIGVNKPTDLERSPMMSSEPTRTASSDTPPEPIRALLILNYDVHDRERLIRYREAASGVLQRGGAVLITSTDQTLSMAEAPSAGTDTVVLGFGSRTAAEAAYSSTTYQAVIGERLASTSPRSALIVGVDAVHLGSTGTGHPTVHRGPEPRTS